MPGHTPTTRLLCINCRGLGHILSGCPDTFQNNEYAWFSSPTRRDFRPSSTPLESPCQRCISLDLATLVAGDDCENAYWKFKSSSPEARINDQRKWRHLGPVSSLVLDEACPVCCCLYVCAPSPLSSEQDLWIFAFPTIGRLGGHFAEYAVNPIHGEGQRPYARYLCLVVWPPRDLDEVDELVQRGDGLCIVEDEEEAEEDPHNSIDMNAPTKAFALGGRLLPQPSYSPSTIQSWIARCSKLHPLTCQPVWNPNLSQIYLLDVRSRRVVRHPGIPCDYIALSYVWGLTPQPIHRFGATLSRLPRTIEDAILVTLALGKDYLWVDSLCIDQSSSGHKAEQISRMCDIYRGAYCTLVALSSTSAESGLPRVSPTIPTVAQLSCSIAPSGGKGKVVKFITTGMTLNQTIWVTKWGTRAWTFQEALLSPRNVYFSDSQIIFECNAMTCCESLDETHSHNHNLFWDDAFITNENPEKTYGLGVLRNPFVGESRRAERMKEWSNLLVLYMYRSMTDSNDSLNAFDGILKALQGELYPGGFHWGIPKEQFNVGLLWLSRAGMRRREGFPSWSWCGWQGALWGPGSLGFVDGVGQQNEHIQPHVKAVAVLDGELLTLFDNSTSLENQEKPSVEVDSLLLSFQYLGLEPDMGPSELFKIHPEQYPGLLYLTAPVLKLRGTSIKSTPSSSESHWVQFTFNEAIFHICYSYCGEGFEEYFGEDIVDWLVLGRENVGGETGEWYILHLLGVIPKQLESGQGDELSGAEDGDDKRPGKEMKQQVVVRLGTIRMWIKRKDNGLLDDLGLSIKGILLA